MQAPANQMLMDYSPTFETTTNTTYQSKEEAAEAWAACLADAKNNPNKYLRVPIENGPFANFEEMWAAKEKGDYDPINSIKHPSGPKPEHIHYLQGLYHRGMTIDEIALNLVAVYPRLMEGWRTGTEYDRRLQIHGLVSIWTSIWAPRVMDDGRMVQRGDYVGGEEEEVMETPRLGKSWGEGGGGGGSAEGPLIRF